MPARQSVIWNEEESGMRYFKPDIEILLFDEDEILTASTTAGDEAVIGQSGNTNASVKVSINQLSIITNN